MGKLDLHEAMAVVLLNLPERSASTKMIQEEIQRRDLYRMQSGNFAGSNQILSRASRKSLRPWFKLLGGGMIRLRNLPTDESDRQNALPD